MGNTRSWNPFCHDRSGNDRLSFRMRPAYSSAHLNFPSCSDELLDWNDDAAQMFGLFLCKGVSKRHDRNKEAEVGDDIFQTMSFLPFVLASAKEQCGKMASMEILERMRFLAENVVVVVRAPHRPPAILTLQSFLSLYTLLLRYIEMVLTMKPDLPEKSSHHCPICLDEDSQLMVLSCTHSLCTQCHKRWVSRHLSCPFCRQTFPQRSVNTSQWELLEWQPNSAIADILHLEAKLEASWNSLDFSETVEELLAVYVLIERTIEVQEECGALTVTLKPKA